MLAGKYFLKLSENGVAELTKSKLTPFIFNSSFLIVDDFDLGYSFASLKAVPVKEPDNTYELWIPSVYIQYVLELKAAEPLSLGFQNMATDSSPDNS